jgi:hypothetical protein
VTQGFVIAARSTSLRPTNPTIPNKTSPHFAEALPPRWLSRAIPAGGGQSVSKP